MAQEFIYTLPLDYEEFRRYLVETDECGPWGDNYFHEVFDKYVDDGVIEIEYKYGDCANGKSEICWRLADTEGCQLGENGKPMNFHKVRRVRYGGSSVFAMWWCAQTDALEEDED
jgi:hypothetical protein